MRKVGRVLLMLVLVFGLTACASKSAGWKAGTYEGEAKGSNGPIKVAVTIDEAKITNIEVLEHHETDGVSDSVMTKIPAAIVAGQGLDVEVVSGASMTSHGVIEAITDALKKAGVDVDALSKIKVALATEKIDKTDYEVVVIGGGGAGLAAAISAAEHGAKDIVLIEKLPAVGGNTLLSGGEMAAPNNWLQEKEGIKDSVDQFYEDILKGGDNENDPKLVRVLAENALDGAKWLRDDIGVTFEDYMLFFGGHSVKRSLVPLNASGAELVKKLKAKAEEMGVTILTDTDAKKILSKDGNDHYDQVMALNNGEEVTFNASKGIVLATGGFGSNLEMRVKYNKDMDDKILSTTSPGSMGDGLNIGEAIGGVLTDMSFIQTYPTCDPETGRLLYVGDVRLEGRSILVNLEGERFVEELERRDVISKAVTQQSDGHSYMFWDQSAMDASKVNVKHKEEYDSLIERGLMVKADTIEEAAKHFGINEKNLAATVEKYNGFAKAGKDEDFKKRGELVPFSEGPYYIMKSIPAVHHTMGGLMINTKAQLIDANQKPIDGVYAAGEVVGDIHGTNRLGSDAIADIIVFGRIAGEGAAK